MKSKAKVRKVKKVATALKKHLGCTQNKQRH